MTEFSKDVNYTAEERKFTTLLEDNPKYQYHLPEVALHEHLKNPELVVVTGSRLYGTARYDDQGNCLSDTDLRAVVIPPWEYLTVLRKPFEQKNGDETEDHLFYSLNFFVEQLLAANPQFLEILFVPEAQVLKASTLAKEMLGMREAFLSKRFYHRLTGFAYSEFRKAQGVKLQFEKETKSEQEIWDTFREVFGPKWGTKRKEITDQIKAMAFSQHEIKLVPSTDGISKKRRDEFDRFGYCASSACHSLRLLRQTTELLKTGTMTFPRPDAVQLRDIKMGKSNLEEFTKLYEEAKLECDAAFKETKLPEDNDVERIQKWYEERVALSFAHDERFRGKARLGYRWV
jgi:predicted nucleotidyltransferase